MSDKNCPNCPCHHCAKIDDCPELQINNREYCRECEGEMIVLCCREWVEREGKA